MCKLCIRPNVAVHMYVNAYTSRILMMKLRPTLMCIHVTTPLNVEASGQLCIYRQIAWIPCAMHSVSQLTLAFALMIGHSNNYIKQHLSTSMLVHVNWQSAADIFIYHCN